MTNTLYKHREIQFLRCREIQVAKDENAGVELIDELGDGLPVLEPDLPICPGPSYIHPAHTWSFVRFERASTKVGIGLILTQY